MTPTNTALIVVDVQRDFCEGGSLAVPGGDAVAAGISDLIEAAGDAYRLVVASRDWHIDPGSHFAPAGQEPDFVKTWPVHCVAGSEGADWHPDLHLPEHVAVISSGEYEAGYSSFEGHDDEGRTLAEVLKSEAIDQVDVVGIATTFCVKATALDAVKAGFSTRVLAPLTADVASAPTYDTLERLRRKGVTIVG